MSCTLSFSSKRTGEQITYAFDLKNVLSPGETISTAVWTSFAVRPTTANTAGMIVGPANIIGTVTSQSVGGGDNNALYNLVAHVVTSFGNIFEPEALLPVSNDAIK